LIKELKITKVGLLNISYKTSSQVKKLMYLTLNIFGVKQLSN